MEQFIRYASSKGVKRRNLLISKSRQLLERNLYGNIIYNMLGQEEYIRYISDATVQKALDILEKGEAFPKAPDDELTTEETDGNGKEKRIAQANSFLEEPAQIFRLAECTVG